MERLPWTVTLTISLFVYLVIAVPLDDDANSFQQDDAKGLLEPVVEKPKETYLVAEGDSLRMSCNIKNPGSSSIVWSRGGVDDEGSTIFADDEPVPNGLNTANYKPDREEHTLTILKVDANSTGLYTCYTSPHTFAEHIVQLKVSVELGHVPKVVEVGENLRLSCKAKGYPEPAVEWWSKKKSSSGSSREELLGSGAERTILDVKVSDSGTYTCSASNGVSNASTSISIKVVNGLSAESDVVFVDLRENTASICCIHGKGSNRELRWLKDGNEIPLSSRYKISTFGKQKQCLDINGTREKDLGVYTCKGEKSFVSTNLTGAPQKPKLTKVTSDKTDPLSPVPVLVWNVSTFAPILSYQIYVRKQGESEWKSYFHQDALISDEKEEVIERRFDELPNGLYATKLVVQNKHGSSELITEDMPISVDMKKPAEGGKGEAGRSYASVGILLTILATLLLCR